jgi:predicted Zn finger-like uncharacterized protein
MILTCPECATSYFVDDARIPATGRTVKCASCAHRWMAVPEGAEAVAAPSPPPSAPEAEPAKTAPAKSDGDLKIKIKSTRPPPAAKPANPGGGKALAWAAMAALVAALIGGALTFRAEVVRLWPQSATTFAGLGLPVNTLGLVIEGVRATPTFQDGRPALSVSGVVRNVEGKAITAPPLRVSLMNRLGKPVAATVARPLNAKIPAGGARHFTITLVDPPSGSHDLEVAFDVGAGALPKSAPATHAAETAPAPIEAEPLPADAPDALPDHG